VAQFGGAGAGLELLLTAQGRLIFQQQSKPFGVVEAARLGFVFKVLECVSAWKSDPVFGVIGVQN
jgi:hypothetical protein